MALFFDHRYANARRFLSERRTSRVAGRSLRARIGRTMPDHICLRLVGAWLVTLVALFALVLAIRWYA